MLKLDVKVDFSEVDRLQRRLPEAKRRGLKAAGKLLAEAMKEEAPVDTGELRGSIAADPPSGDSVVVHAGRGLPDRRAAATQARENWGGKALFGAQGRLRRAVAAQLRKALSGRGGSTGAPPSGIKVIEP